MAAYGLVLDCLNDDSITDLVELGDGISPVLVSVHAEEQVGVNAIPEVMADVLAGILDWEVEHQVVQANVVNHTGANGFARMARQAFFAGTIDPRRMYIVVDDFIGQGGTIANLRGHIEDQGGIVLAATVLTGKAFSAQLHQEPDQLHILRTKHGQLEEWWRGRFGFASDALTASETRYLTRTEASERIRTCIEDENC